MTPEEALKTAKIKIISYSDITNCPSVILLPSHYRDNGSCRCDEDNCEEDNCSKLKMFGEIFCEDHIDD